MTSRGLVLAVLLLGACAPTQQCEGSHDEVLPVVDAGQTDAGVVDAGSSPQSHREWVSVLGPDGGLPPGVSGTLRPDDGTGPFTATVDTDRLVFTVPPETHPGWGAWLAISAPNHLPFETRVILHAEDHELIAPVTLRQVGLDPATITLRELAAIRGAMWTAQWNGAFGPRPGQSDNVLATAFIACYPAAEQLRLISEYKSRGYTHVVIGPIVDSDGYHGQYCVNDWRTQFDRFLDLLELFWTNGLVPIVFLHPDNWTFDQTQALTPLLTSARAQRLIRVIVPAGWEPARTEWSNATWIRYARWGRETFPNALNLLHTPTDLDAPLGNDALGTDLGTLSNGEAWRRIVPYLHGWLTQSAAFENPTAHGDPNQPTKTNFDNWRDQFDCAVTGSLCARFHAGYAGWPTTSAWGNEPLRIYAGEYASYWVYWQHRTENEAKDWGDAAMRAGADGYLDSGRLPVPVR